jgi:signal transduction histidine kinase/ActR/RegA family two-component response regulator
MKRFLQDIFVPTGAGRHGRAEWSLHWLLAASIVLPVAGFAVGATISYRQHLDEARDRLQRNLGTVYEHALKVFETTEITSRYLDQLLGAVTDEQITAAEADYHSRLRAFTETLPQLADIWVTGPEGRPLVSGTVFPMPRGLTLADRDYFRVHRNKETGDLYISDVRESLATDARGRPRLFTISRNRAERDGRFAGITAISVSPEYFLEYYATLTQPLIAALYRSDGTMLVRYPAPPPQFARVPADGPFMNVMRAGSEIGLLTLTAFYDGKQRMFAYRKLPRHGVYAVAGMELDDIAAATIRSMSSHLIFGLPATVAMILLCLMALRRARREEAANEMLRTEIARREATEEALRQSQKMEAVGRLTGGIAHDFNNLLTAIIGNLDLALRRLDGEERVRGWLTNSRRAGERAATLVQRLLAFSRQHPLEVKSVDVNRLVQEMSDLLGRTIGETVTIETVLAGGLWKAAIDPNQLENTILNLAVNARDAMPGGGRLTIETANCHLDEHYVEQAGAEIAPGQYVMVAVSDSGSGMAREVMSRAFEPFFTTKPPGTGTGLGLSQAYGFAKQSGGHIRIYSEVGVGTTIKLYFPRLAGGGDVPAWSARETAAPAPATGGSETILVVEDDPQVNQLATEALEECGYRVLSAGDGPAALRLIEESPVDLLLTDVVLPNGMNGRELADEVRRRRPGTGVLYVTGYTRNAIIHHGRLDPDIDLLTKPFTADALTRKIRSILDGGKAQTPKG